MLNKTPLDACVISTKADRRLVEFLHRNANWLGQSMPDDDGQGSTHRTSVGRSRNMAAIKRRDTQAERLIRSVLHSRGLRYRVDMRIDLPRGRVRPDIVFTRAKVAVFVDGCFWHACPVHGRQPTANEMYWTPKLAGNVARDVRNTQALEDDGWSVMRFWEHEPPDACADRVEMIVRQR